MYAQKQALAQKKNTSGATSVLDASSQSEGLQRKADMANNAAQREEVSRPNNTGMPDNLKSGIESLSGFSMDDVRVHYNSSKPATVQALAYTQGTDIHVAPGQEKHLPHEAWHVAQQMAGRVSPTTNINGMPVNDNAALEHEADVMGEKAVGQMYKNSSLHAPICKNTTTLVSQRVKYTTVDQLLDDVLKICNVRQPRERKKLIKKIHDTMNQNPNLITWYDDAVRHLANVDFVNHIIGANVYAGVKPKPRNEWEIGYEHSEEDTDTQPKASPEMLCILVLHELMHIDCAEKYNNPSGPEHLFTTYYNGDADAQDNLLFNISQLASLWQDENATLSDKKKINWINMRMGTLAALRPFGDYDTVLGDLVYYMISQNLTHLKTYHYANKLLAEANERRNNPGQAARVLKPKKHFWQFWR